MNKFIYNFLLAISLTATSLQAIPFYPIGNNNNYERDDLIIDNNPTIPDEIPEASSRNKVRYGAVTIKNFIMRSLAEEGKVIYVAPGMVVTGFAQYEIDRGTDSTINQIIVGFDKGGAQTAIYNGGSLSKGTAHFSLTAPQEPGVYEVRFRYAQAYTAVDAVKYWWNVDGAPSEQSTIGLVIVDEYYGYEDIARPLNDKNFAEYLVEKYGTSGSLLNNVTIHPLLANQLINFDDFWKNRDGRWIVAANTVLGMPTAAWNVSNYIDSKDAFRTFDIIVDTQHRITNPKNGWSYARGFGISYYIDKKHNVEFHYFADVKKASLYIRDDEKVVEHIETLVLPEFRNQKHHIRIENGEIFWSINGVILFDDLKTTLKAGKLRLINSNNETKFTL